MKMRVCTVLMIMTGFVGLFGGLGAKENNQAAKAPALPQIQSTEQFTKLVENNPRKLLAFDLYADWCGPCRMLSPILEQIAVEQQDKVLFYKINVDRFPDISRLFGVSNIPVIAFVKNRQTVHAILGLQPKEAYVQAIKTYSTDNSKDTARVQASAQARQVSAAEAKDLIAKVKPLVLDVRRPDEFTAGHLPGARLIPLDQLERRLAEIDSFKTKPVLVYCRTGNRSSTASEILVKNGFKNVYHLQGGILDWKNSGGAVTTDK